MKKVSLLLAAAMMLTVSATQRVQAGIVDNVKARQVAAYYMASQFGNKAITADNLKLVYQIDNVELNVPALYFFNTADERGFVVVSGDDCFSPIVAFSPDGSFDPNNIPPSMMWFLNEQVDNICYAQNNRLERQADVAACWRELEEQTLPYFGVPQKAVTQLMSSAWNQTEPYNNWCPMTSSGRAVTGCVATAMAQIIYYWRYPYVGNGIASYQTDAEEGTIYYSQQYYDYSKMLDTVYNNSPQEAKDEVAKLSFHCGVAVSMNYTSDVSGASSQTVPNAMRQKFKYLRDSMQYVVRSQSYPSSTTTTSPTRNDTLWVQMLRAEIAAKRPIYYSGHDYSTSGEHAGHAFVCDGYRSTDGMMHFNWGWGSAGDCYCNVYTARLRPRGMGYNFTSDHAVVRGLQPPVDTLNARVGIHDVEASPVAVSVYPNPASEEITVNFQVAGSSAAEIEIYDMTGRRIEGVRVQPWETHVRIAVGNYAPGVYVCRMQGQSVRFVVK